MLATAVAGDTDAHPSTSLNIQQLFSDMDKIGNDFASNTQPVNLALVLLSTNPNTIPPSTLSTFLRQTGARNSSNQSTLTSVSHIKRKALPLLIESETTQGGIYKRSHPASAVAMA